LSLSHSLSHSLSLSLSHSLSLSLSHSLSLSNLLQCEKKNYFFAFVP
jgi:hypothetical protein